MPRAPGVEAGHELPRHVEEHERARDVGVDEGLRAVNRAVHVRFRREIEHTRRPVLGEHPRPSHRDRQCPRERT